MVLRGIKPHLGKHTAGVALSSDLLSGDLALRPFGAIAAAAQVKTFKLESFYLACAVATNTGLVMRAQGCVVTVSGRKPNGQQVPSATFPYAPTEALKPNPSFDSVSYRLRLSAWRRSPLLSQQVPSSE